MFLLVSAKDNIFDANTGCGRKYPIYTQVLTRCHFGEG